MKRKQPRTAPWVEKYRPKKLDDLICGDNLKQKLQEWVGGGYECPHLLLLGSPGCGKTCLVQVLANELDAELMQLNAADERKIDTLRGKIRRFVTMLSLQGKGIKIVLLDEAEHLTKDFQAALRGEMERFFRKTKFFLTCNSLRKIDDAIQSRCSVIEIVKPDYHSLLDRLEKVLNQEGIQYNTNDLEYLVEKKYPDIRSIIQSLQYHSRQGRLVVDKEEKDYA